METNLHTLVIFSSDLDENYELHNKDSLLGQDIWSVFLPHGVKESDVKDKDWFKSIRTSSFSGIRTFTLEKIEEEDLERAYRQEATVPEASPSGSIKNDRLDHKLRWELLPLDLVEHLVAVYTFGAEKYSENSWQNLPDGYRRYKAALFRHIVAFEKGESIDPESGLPHLAHAAWNALALIYFSNQQTPDNNGN